MGHLESGLERPEAPKKGQARSLRADTATNKAPDGAHSLPVLVRAALARVQFETIHPFLDGNGRLGRLLIVLMLIDAGVLQQPLLYLSLFFKQHRSRYFERLSGIRQDAQPPFCLRRLSGDSQRRR